MPRNLIRFQEAAKRGIYGDLKRADLLQRLPFDDDTFDMTISTAVTTYISEGQQVESV